MTERQTLHTRFEPRLRGGLFAGFLLGALVGGTLGFVVGLLAFDGRTGAILACGLGGLVAGLLYGALVGSFAGLESPNPGDEPSETKHPLSQPAVEEEADRSDALRREGNVQ